MGFPTEKKETLMKPKGIGEQGILQGRELEIGFDQWCFWVLHHDLEGTCLLNCSWKVSWIMRRRRREKRASPQVLEQCVEVQFACRLGLISRKEERSWQDFKTWVRKKVVVLIREERKSLKLKHMHHQLINNKVFF